MHYLSVDNISKSFGAKPLFNNISLNISEGDKVGLIAKNGAGKSTMLNIIAGRDNTESGKIWVHKDVKICFLDQEPEFDLDKTVWHMSWAGWMNSAHGILRVRCTRYSRD